MEQENADLLPVIEAADHFIGVAWRSTAAAAMLESGDTYLISKRSEHGIRLRLSSSLAKPQYSSGH